MALKTKVSGTWKHVRASVKVAGAWREVPQMYVRVGGGWKPLYTFSWEAGAWSSCSASCGGGTQTRDVKCRRSDGQYFNDAVGARFAGEKPAAGQPCNTHACWGPKECRYVGVDYSLPTYGIQLYSDVVSNCGGLHGATWRWGGGTVFSETTYYESMKTEVTASDGCRYSRGEVTVAFGWSQEPGYNAECWGEWQICRQCPA